VAFDDERDLRSAVPDRRHRCYAVLEPEPRALAHQERYCLSPTFTSCPIFQDWAAREAAHVAPSEEAVRGVPAGAAGAAAAGALGGASRAGLFDEAPSAGVPERGGASARPAWQRGRDVVEDRFDDEDEDVAAGAASASAAAFEREWDRPRRARDYPVLGRRRTSPIITAIAVLAIAALALFLLPTLLRGFLGGGGPGASPSPTGAAASGSPGASATAGGTAAASGGVPSPTPLTYVIQKGDNLTKIASKFNTTISAILAANPDIKNANDIKVGETIVIPTLGASFPTASPSP
jgi:hypothetical protein